jgi:hypothetical protein
MEEKKETEIETETETERVKRFMFEVLNNEYEIYNSYNLLKKILTKNETFFDDDNPITNTEYDVLKELVIMFPNINITKFDSRTSIRESGIIYSESRTTRTIIQSEISKYIMKKCIDFITEDILQFIDNITVSQIEKFFSDVEVSESSSIIFYTELFQSFGNYYIKNKFLSCKKILKTIYNNLYDKPYNIYYLESFRWCFALYISKFSK